MFQVFFHISKTKEDKFFTCMQYVGQKCNANKFMCKFTFMSPDFRHTYTASHETPSYQVESFDEDHCVELPYAFVKRFMTTKKSLKFETEIFRAFGF